MADHESVQQAEATAAGKVSELTEGMIRLLLQQRAEQAKEHGNSQEKPYVPSSEDTALFESFYQAYRENGVDRETAKAAAADAAIGLGSKESPLIQQAEAQAIAHAQRQAQEYRSVTATAVNPSTLPPQRQQANAQRKDLERSLGIQDKPVEVKAQTINGLDPKDRTPVQSPNIQPEPVPPQQAKAAFHQQPGPTENKRKALEQTYQETLEEQGAKPNTAVAAGRDLADGKGAADSPVVAQAEQEIQHHQVLKNMYQGVYEKHGVSPEVASKAADQLARGNGANRSPDVRTAHSQALMNIETSQQVAQTNGRDRSAESRQAPVPEAAAPNSSPKNNQAQTSQTQPKAAVQEAPPQTKNEASTDGVSPQNNPRAQQIWNEFGPGKNGVFATMHQGSKTLQKETDVSVAKSALLAGHNPKDIQAAISQHSPYAQGLKGPDSYASRTVEKAEYSSEVKEKRAKEQAQDAPPSRKEAQKQEAQKNQPNQPNKSATKDKPKQKNKSQDKGMSY